MIGYVFYGLAFLSAVQIFPKMRKCNHQHKVAFFLIMFVIGFYLLAETYWLFTVPQFGNLSLAKELWIAHDAVVGLVLAIILNEGNKKL